MNNNILPDDSARTTGKDAQRNNIMAARIVSDIVKTTLGPRGMDKMLVSSSGDITITNDGVTILEEMEVVHPAARMMVEIAKTQEREVGDGTTTAVMLAGKLLELSEPLLDNKIHPTTIIKGYQRAMEKSLEILRELSFTINHDSREGEEALRCIVKTAITGKGAEVVREKYSELIVRAVKQIIIDGRVDLSNIKIEKILGGSIENTELLEGIVFDCPRINKEMSPRVINARIALIDTPIEAGTDENKISISTPEQLQGFIDREERIIKGMIEKLKSVNANVVICQKGIDEVAQFYLAREGIYACRRVPRSDMEKISKATGARIISNINDLMEEHLGMAGEVEEVREGDELTFIKNCKNPRAITIIVRGGTQHVVDEVTRAINDGLGVVATAIKEGKIVAGGGATEIELARRLRQFSRSLNGREQLAVEKFSEALEFIPTTLAENAGMDPIDTITKLRSSHDAGSKNYGLNLFSGDIDDNIKAGIVEPARVKSQAINSATEVASMILRIDDVIAANNKKSEPRMNMIEED